MILDLYHNKIVKDTMTEEFARSVSEALLPKISEKYLSSLIGIQMYEDYLKDGFMINSVQYYPLTVLTERGVFTQWISWAVNSDFENGIPYSYVGKDNIDFSLLSAAPEGFDDKLISRKRFCESGLIKINIETPHPDKTFLSGRYSQTFIDEMARQITPAIISAMSIEDIPEGVLELSLVFAPETYMEHTSENVTYRRLLLSDKSSAPRDFWIKWTRLNGAQGFTVSDNVSGEDIVFELGEDVSQKIREKEYRFLLRMGKDKYHNSMGRKNITEWREVVKRSIRRGDLKKVDREVAISEETIELEKQLADILGRTAPQTVTQKEIPEIKESLDFTRAMELAKDALGRASEINFDDEDDEIDNFDIEAGAEDELSLFYKEEETQAVGEGAVAESESEADELDEITRLAREALSGVRQNSPAEIVFSDEDCVVEESDEDLGDSYEDASEEEYEDEEFAGVYDEEIIDEEGYADEYDDMLGQGEELIAEEEYEADGDDFSANEEELRAEPISDSDEEDRDNAKSDDVPHSEPQLNSVIDTNKFVTREELSAIRDEIEKSVRGELEARIRLEYEREARLRAEDEAFRLRKEQENMKLELEKLHVEAKKLEAERAEREEERLAETERLKAQLEAQHRADSKERERIAEAARLALEEQKRLEEEKMRVERMRLEEARRLEEEREALRIENERRAEAERIRLEAQTNREGEAASISEQPTEKDGAASPEYTYTSKSVKLLFRRSVDPNITARIYEIIKATVEYYGKENVYLKIRATVPTTESVNLEFVKIPEEEMELLSNIIKVLGNSGLGIAKAIVE